MGEKVASVIVQGLYKGYVDRFNRQNSPICYGYYRAGVPPFSRDEWSYEWRRGLDRYPSWRREGGIKKHMADMPAYMLAEQFPQVPPMIVNDSLVETFFKQRAIRESEIASISLKLKDQSLTNGERQQLLDKHFGQNFEACRPSWGHGCNYHTICHGSIADPLKAGFSVRHSHHEREQAALASE